MRVIIHVGMNSLGDKGIRLDVVRPDGQADFVRFPDVIESILTESLTRSPLKWKEMETQPNIREKMVRVAVLLRKLGWEVLNSDCDPFFGS